MENINIPTPKGNISAVIHEPQKQSDRLAILCPGWLDSKDYNHLIGLADTLSQNGYTVVRFDYLGTWESEGSLKDHTIQQQLEDIKNVLEFMMEKYPCKNILLGGHSRGGMVSILYAVSDPRISAVLAVMSPYTIGRTVDKDKMDQWKKDGFKTSVRNISGSKEEKQFQIPYSNIEEAQKYNVLEEINKLHVPLYLVTGDLDDVVPPEDVKAIYEKANDPKKFLMLKNIGHDYRHNLEEVKKVDGEITEMLGL